MPTMQEHDPALRISDQLAMLEFENERLRELNIELIRRNRTLRHIAIGALVTVAIQILSLAGLFWGWYGGGR